MLCPHCKKWVPASMDGKAWRLAAALDPADPTCIPLDKNDLCVEANIEWWEFEDVKRHYRDHLVAQTGLTLSYDRRADLYWRTPEWADLTNPDIKTWETEGLKRLHTEARHYSDGLAVALKSMPTTGPGSATKRHQVRDLHSDVSHMVERIELALENAALQ